MGNTSQNARSGTIGIASKSAGWPGSKFWGSTPIATLFARSRGAWRRKGRTPHDSGRPSVKRLVVNRPRRAAFLRHFAARLWWVPISLQFVVLNPVERSGCEPLPPRHQHHQ